LEELNSTAKWNLVFQLNRKKENEKNRKKEIDISGKAVIMDMFAERGTESNRTYVLFLFPHIFVSAAQQGRGSAS
jgi:hypothetical protein